MVIRILVKDKCKWELPYMTFSIIDVHKSPNYELIWLYQGIVRVPFATCVIAIDTLVAGILLLLCAQCKLVQNAFKCIITNAYAELEASRYKVDRDLLIKLFTHANFSHINLC